MRLKKNKKGYEMPKDSILDEISDLEFELTTCEADIKISKKKMRYFKEQIDALTHKRELTNKTFSLCSFISSGESMRLRRKIDRLDELIAMYKADLKDAGKTKIKAEIRKTKILIMLDRLSKE